MRSACKTLAIMASLWSKLTLLEQHFLISLGLFSHGRHLGRACNKCPKLNGLSKGKLWLYQGCRSDFWVWGCQDVFPFWRPCWMQGWPPLPSGGGHGLHGLSGSGRQPFVLGAVLGVEGLLATARCVLIHLAACRSSCASAPWGGEWGVVCPLSP